MPDPVATSSARQDEGANNQSLTPANEGNVIAIGETNENAPVGTSSTRQDEGANNQSLTPSNPGNEIEI